MNEHRNHTPLPVNRLGENFFATLYREIARKTASGADVIRLDIGSPDLPPADHVIEALTHSAAQVDSHGYQSHRGTQALRKAWVELLQQRHNVSLDEETVLPLIGSKEGVFHLSLAWLNPGDRVLVPDPGYQTYTQSARLARAEPFLMPLLPENGYLPDLEAIPEKIACRARILWLNYPNNPTGAVASLDFFNRAVGFCHQYDILLCHDAPYMQVTYEGYQSPSVFQVPGALDVAIEFGSLSKVYNMAGWRVGFAAGQVDAIAALVKLKTHADSGHFLPIMEAAVSALTGDQSWVEARNEIYRVRRDVLVAGLRSLGLNPNQPQAAIYVWCPLPSGWDSEDFVLTLLENAHVSVAPGSIFGPHGEGFFRISLTQPEERIREALERIRGWFNESQKLDRGDWFPKIQFKF